jgi:leucyl aminopeptidase
MLQIGFAKPALPGSGALVLLVEQEAKPSGLWLDADHATGGAIARALEVAKFNGEKDKLVTILAPGAGLSHVVVVGLGRSPTLRELESAGGKLAAALRTIEAGGIAAEALSGEQAAAVALGATLRSWRFDQYRTREKPEEKPKLAKLTVFTSALADAASAWGAASAVADGVFLTRSLVSEPANILTPVEFADRAAALRELGVKVEVLGQKQLEKLGFGALLGVSQGSANEPRVVVMEWFGESGEPDGKGGGNKKGKGKAKHQGERPQPVCFVGKGVTFDTGGISIKPAGGMEDMKWDMAGAGTVTGLMAALAGRRARVDAIGIIGLVENMPSATAQRPGDVVTSYSGQTIEVINTDAEGRLVLADILWYVREKYNPRFMIDLATLTGAIIIALGHEYAGLYANDDALAEQLIAAGRATGEKLWRMPLDKGYENQIKSDIADLKNVGGRPGGSITAAQFLQHFVDKRPWAHLDIAGMAWSSKATAVTPKGATAFGVRLLDRLVADYYEAK